IVRDPGRPPQKANELPSLLCSAHLRIVPAKPRLPVRYTTPSAFGRPNPAAWQLSRKIAGSVISDHDPTTTPRLMRRFGKNIRTHRINAQATDVGSAFKALPLRHRATPCIVTR